MYTSAEFVNIFDPEDRWKFLRGLPGVEVVIEDICPDAECDCLQESTLQTAVEARLRIAGIRVLTNEERYETSREAWLYVQVSTFRNPSGFYAYDIGCRINEIVPFLWSDPSMQAYVTAWMAHGVTGTVGADNLRDVKDAVLEQVDAFINDYLRANPK